MPGINQRMIELFQIQADLDQSREKAEATAQAEKIVQMIPAFWEEYLAHGYPAFPTGVFEELHCRFEYAEANVNQTEHLNMRLTLNGADIVIGPGWHVITEDGETVGFLELMASDENGFRACRYVNDFDLEPKPEAAARGVTVWDALLFELHDLAVQVVTVGNKSVSAESSVEQESVTPPALTLRQYYAGLALQGLLANTAAIPNKEIEGSRATYRVFFSRSELARWAVESADALIAELDQEQTGD